MSDFERNVYCIAGLPFDAVDIHKTVNLLRDAKHHKTNCFLTTPNTNFLSIAVKDVPFRQSVIHSDIVIADGLPIVWMAIILGLPITHRVAGSSLFELLSKETRRKMKVYFFGGLDGVAEAACHHLNKSSQALSCVGFCSPGFGSIDDISHPNIIENINKSGADFLVVALGAKKGQEWIVRNQPRIIIPLVSHLGAVINFQANTLKRAPVSFQNMGLEWLWRIKEEPKLWKRYFRDGLFFAQLLVTKILPLAIWWRCNKHRMEKLATQARIELVYKNDEVVMKVVGAILDPMTQEIRDMFREASKSQRKFILDLTEANYVSYGFLGLVLMLKKTLDQQGLNIQIVTGHSSIKKIIDWNGLNYLIK